MPEPTQPVCKGGDGRLVVTAPLLAHDEADHGRRAELNGLAIRLDNVGSLHDA